jgi:hypothetical protein
MAYVYTTGGHEIYARSETREELTNRIQGDRDAVLEVKANGCRRRVETDPPLPVEI